MSENNTIELDFSSKYDQQHAQQYLVKHQDGLARRLSNWRDMQLARKALKDAGEPGLVLDLPCGAGRFRPVLAEAPQRTILAADYSSDMLETARNAQPPELVARVKMFQTSAFDIDLGDNAVDSIFCMRLIHHVASAEHRLALLRECARVTRDTLIISLWVDGNFKAWKRRRLEAHRSAHGRPGQNQNRFVVARSAIEAEFREAGFSLVNRHDFCLVMPCGASMYCEKTRCDSDRSHNCRQNGLLTP
ncbi:Methyltransferase domain-containing protein [Halopseudomonas salegens]|uniref:Methyltransferase domain-containing protein n=1 Tax=Halopseudomonas salegens TaxID=1434072 RepID=A0A1H2E1A0_9GAMM|nr:Methyltransferase domain-containing protein [Halopseudomonas salegens]